MKSKEYIQLETAFHGKNLEIVLCYYCNYKCDYCYNRRCNVKDVMDVKRLKHFIDISNATSVVLLGGEPTMYPDLLELLIYLKEKKIEVSIITNNSVDITWWEKHIQYFDSVFTSYHIDHTNYEKFLQNIQYIKNHALVFNSICMQYERFEECWNIFEKFKNVKEIILAAKELRNKGKVYKEKYIKRLNTTIDLRTNKIPLLKIFKVYDDGTRENISTEDLLLNQEHRFKGWLCSMGLNSLCIRANGDLYRANCEDTFIASFGNIYDDNVQLPTDFSICHRETCDCRSEIRYNRKIKVIR